MRRVFTFMRFIRVYIKANFIFLRFTLRFHSHFPSKRTLSKYTYVREHAEVARMFFAFYKRMLIAMSRKMKRRIH